MAPTLELFHRIAHPPSAKVRRYLRDQALEELVRMRNVDFDEHLQDYLARGGTGLPALWDGQRLYEGAELVISRLSSLVDIGRSG
ncbi:MAG TPA: hypothetical protein VK447_19830 [Myxococcaceae bacterium]|nr:hypothetical protein [Myxococcaceae bacterium]